MTNKKTALTVLGFLLAGLGFLSIVLSLVGLGFSYLSWLNYFGKGTAFLIKILMTFGGFILIYIAQTDWEKEEI